MHNRHAHHGPPPFFIFATGLLLFAVLGFKVFFLLPLLFIFGSFGKWGMCGTHHHEQWSDEKPKRKEKPKRDTYIDDGDDVTYV